MIKNSAFSVDGGFQGATEYGLTSVQVLASLVVMVLCVSLLIGGWSGPASPPVLGLPPRLFGAIGTLYSMWAFSWSFRFLLDRRPRLSISADGILNRTYWHVATVIPWNEVVEVRKTGIPGIREVVLRDPQRWLRGQPASVRAGSRVTRLLGMGRIPLNLWVLSDSRVHVDEQVQAALDHFELASYAESQGSEYGRRRSSRNLTGSSGSM